MHNIFMRRIFLNLIIIFLGFFIVQKTYALILFDIVGPEGQLQSGQEVIFTININTDGKSYSSAMIGMTYDTQYLQYVSVTPGNTFTTITMTPAGNGNMIINGSSASPYSGTGVFAYVTFKIIATAPGSTKLCALYNPDVTPTSPQSTLASQLTNPPTQLTNPPTQLTNPPTALPKAGVFSLPNQIVLGILFLALAGIGFAFFKKI